MSDSSTTSMSALFGRILWLMIGPLALILALYHIVTTSTGWWDASDIIYFVILGGMILGKWLEFRGGNPQTASGEPATPAQLRRYALTVLVAGPIIWVLANLVGNR
jgi:hypothetical protein